MFNIEKLKREIKANLFQDNDLSDKREMRKRINTLENELDTLKEIIKGELYKSFMDKLGEPDTLKRLKEENKKLRQRIKSYKEEIKNDNS